MIPLFSNNLTTVENPTAGLLSKGEARVHQKLFKNNGMMIGADVGLFDSFQFGVSYGVENLVGDKKPHWYKNVEFKAKFRIIEEGLAFPAIAIGVDTQGHGAYHKDLKRYDIKSKGIYAVASKNWDFLGLFGFDIGVNYSFEDNDNSDTNFDAFAGIYKTIGSSVTIYADYTAAINDYYKKSEDKTIADELVEIYGNCKGYLNAAIQVRINDQFTIKLLIHDLLKNKSSSEIFDRSIVLDYRWFF
jgi:hypothetical protein